MSQRAKKILIITGDPSGDFHGANVAKALIQRQPDIQIAAVGGVHLAGVDGVQMLSDQSRMGRVGLGSIWGAPEHLMLGNRILKFARDFKPDAVLHIDYGVFNLWMAGRLKKAGFKPFYFIPPQVWASRQGRIKKIKRNVDHVFCILPFEPALYQAYGIPVTYVGHPLLGQLPPAVNRQAFCEQYHLDPNKKIIGLFPGSRKMEIDYLLTPLIQSLPLIRQQYPDAQFILAKAAHLNAGYFGKKLSEAIQTLAVDQQKPDLQIIEHANHAVLSVSDAIIAASGTVTLEAALYETPMVIIYKGHPISYQIFKQLCKTPYIGMPNVLSCIPDINHLKENIAPPVVPELLQTDLTSQSITAHLLPLLDQNSASYYTAKKAFTDIRAQLGIHQAPEAVAEKLLTSI